MSKRSPSQVEASRASVSVVSGSAPRNARPRVECLFPMLEPARAPTGARDKNGPGTRKPTASAVSAVTTSFNPYAPQDQLRGQQRTSEAPAAPSSKDLRSQVSAEKKAEAVEPQPKMQVQASRYVADELPFPASVVSSYQSSWRPEFAKAEPGVCFQRGIIGQEMRFTKPTSLGVNYFRMPDYPDRETLGGKDSLLARQSQRNADWLNGLLAEAEQAAAEGNSAKRASRALRRAESEVSLDPITEHRRNYRSYAKYQRFLEGMQKLGQGVDPYHSES
mmetsp:Transcript_36502/g.66903  ORF Transcript_36502/g.66903 Transcript_36502/m.66903 type:complete len:277 (-) Transcript_36502:43-873(-)